jgi:hypothetical protein
MTRLRAALVLVVALAFVTVQSFWLGTVASSAATTAHAHELASLPTVVVADDDNGNGGDDDDDDDDGEDDDGDDNDNGDDCADNDNNGNEEDNANNDDNDNQGDKCDPDDNDNSDHSDDFSSRVDVSSISDTPAPSKQASSTTSGRETTVSLQNGRVVLRASSSLPSGTTLTLRLVDPGSLPPISGRRLGDLLFIVEASAPGGAGLASLPAEVNLSARYTDQDIVGANEQAVVLSYLDQPARQWNPAPKLARDAGDNSVAATITSLGYYVVQVPL